MTSRTMKVFAALATGVMLLSACAGAAQPAPAATSAPKQEAPKATDAPKQEASKATDAPKAAAATSAPAAGGSGKTIKFYVGLDRGDDVRYQKYADEWSAKSGVKVQLVSKPTSATEALAQILQFMSAKSGDVDVYQFDVIWPGILAEHFVDLNQYIPKEEMATYFPAIVQNNTVGGKLIGVPWFTDAGLLYYRTDLLKKYGYNNPPATWDELEQMAKKIQDGERAAGNASFWGFVFQGNNYEGLTCDALEWQVSSGGGQIVESDGKISINNDKAAAAFDRAAKWVGSISPKDVTTYKEEEARGVWQAGNAAFMRNWPYAYSAGQTADSKIKGLFDVSVLPSGGARNAATLGGWQLGVTQYSKNVKEAAEFVRFMAGKDIQKRNAVEASLLPTIQDLYKDPDVLKASPFFGNLFNVFTSATARPSTVTAELYNEVSVSYAKNVNAVLTGQQTGKDAVAKIEAELQKILK